MDPDPEPLFILLFAFDSMQAINLLVLILLLICSALISGSEVSLFSLTPSDLKLESEDPTVSQKIISKLLSRPKKLLATILVANNFINIAIVLLFDTLGEIYFKGLDDIVVPGLEWLSVRFVVEVGLVAFLILLFGEILPKIYASRNNVKFANFMARPLRVLDWIITPISLPMRSVTVLIHSRLGKQKSNISVDQLSQALELTSDTDTTSEEKKILEGIVSFGNTDTKQVMKPRIDIFALNQDMEYAKVIPEIIENGYSRIPVYKDSIDKVTGILYVKDLLPYINHKDYKWVDLVRAPYFVPENKKLDDLLNDFKDKKNHLAIVVDEYGGTSGLISLEDIIEEIVGDISDEFDDEDLIFSKLDDNNFVFEGRTSLKDFYKVVKLEDHSVFENKKGDAETIAGLLLEISGSFPKRGDVITVESYTFKIESLDNKRIKRIKLTINEE
ncbi:gliding motility-associated protein GldE [Aquimarina sp. BL5]|uniref:gliding motility-associated protein GldE n=1 Tax=Aquimarina sp. BL5 TaxID=1714860 RepID=UPI000E4D92FC|nr:gliding motility-associated protein GldE [Aquimarina sp. BL5]AXT52262.1 gliding motility-associated protein GldE [Aquimarina sp. BL5]RKN09934.1 gliding motility-associated protein GldE [Aquimarina sp. BL5]